MNASNFGVERSKFKVKIMVEYSGIRADAYSVRGVSRRVQTVAIGFVKERSQVK